jgi:hypothetical protein
MKRGAPLFSKKFLRNAAIVLAIAVVAYVVMYGVQEGFQAATVLDTLPEGNKVLVLKKDLQLSPVKNHTITPENLSPFTGKIKDIEFYFLTGNDKWQKIMNPRFDNCGAQDITATMTIGASVQHIKKPGTAVCPNEKVEYRMGQITDAQAEMIKKTGFTLNRVETQNLQAGPTQKVAVAPRATPQNRNPPRTPIDNLAVVIHFM